MYHVLIPDNVDKQAVMMLVEHPEFTVNAPGKMERADALSHADEAHALIIRSGTTVDAEFFDAAPHLKAIARAGVGVDNVDLAEATKRGVVVMNTPNGNTISTAEYTIGLMLSLARHIPQGHQSMCEGRWDRKAYTGIELRNKTLGIIGFGRIGAEVAKRAIPFGMTIVAYDPYPNHEVANAIGVTLTDLDTVYKEADFLSLHGVLNDDTRGMINANAIAKMKAGVRIVNAARGPIINDEDLATAITNGHVSGAALDVYAQEPPSNEHPLLNLDGVIHTPHLAASTSDAQVQVGLDAAQQIIDGLTDEAFINVVNPDVLKK